jgi:hypothetical protein
MNLLQDTKLYKLNDAAVAAGVHPGTIQRAITAGDLKSVKGGKGRTAPHYIRESALQEWMAGRVRES